MNNRLAILIALWVLTLGYSRFLFAAAPSAASNESVPEANTLTAKVIPGLTGRLKAVESTFCGNFSDDVLTLIVSSGGKTFLEHPFCSSYGKASAAVVVDAHGANYVLLDFGSGRGTNAVTEYLDVFQLQKDMIECAQIPLSQGAGPISRWYYDFQVSAPSAGGLTFNLQLRLDGDGPTWVTLPEKARTISIGTASQEGQVVYKSDHRIF